MGCNAILGIEGASYEPGALENEGGAPPPDGSSNPMQDAPIGADVAPDACGAADLKSDPKNCGACNRDCMGGACMGGKCQLAVLATETSADTKTRLLLDGTHVYWTNEATHELSRVPKAGGARQLLFTATTNFGTQPWLTASEIVFTGTNGDKAFGCAKSGCLDGGPRTFLNGVAAGSFTTNPAGTVLYFADLHNIGVCNLPVCDAPTFPTPGQSSDFVLFLAADKDGLVWTTLGFAGSDAGAQVRGSDLVDSTYPLASFAPNGFPNEVVIKGSRIFVTVPGVGVASIMRGGGGTPVILAKGGNYVNGLAVDDKYVWFVQQGAKGKVQRCPLEGCTAPEDVLVDLDSPASIAVDDKFVYVYRAPSGGVLGRAVK